MCRCPAAIDDDHQRVRPMTGIDYLEHAVAIGGAVVTVASAICALTKTPDPTTRLGKLYRAVEIAGLLIGRAKEAGLMPNDPAADQVAAFVVGVAKAALVKA